MIPNAEIKEILIKRVVFSIVFFWNSLRIFNFNFQEFFPLIAIYHCTPRGCN